MFLRVPALDGGGAKTIVIGSCGGTRCGKSGSCMAVMVQEEADLGVVWLRDVQHVEAKGSSMKVGKDAWPN